jgi:pyruvate/2-oxoglutarate dehydrogenase complex dihydrolipoamide dehydrogenase (E3) component
VEGGEIMTIIQVAMLGKLPDTVMADAVFTHPLLAEGLNTLFADPNLRQLRDEH